MSAEWCVGPRRISRLPRVTKWRNAVGSLRHPVELPRERFSEYNQDLRALPFALPFRDRADLTTKVHQYSHCH